MLTDSEFAFISREVKARSGALLTPEMNAAAEQRLQSVARREGFSSVSELLTAARVKQDPKVWGAIADALVQTETRFFRDRATFQKLRTEILPDLFARRGLLRIWCAGCATGQEAYSLAMMIEAMKAEGALGAEIIATDVSERLLDKARSGLFTQFEVQRGLPIRQLIAHFEKVGDLWRISDRLRASVRFEQHNLLQHPGVLAGARGHFDLVLCCNVINSFDQPTRRATLERVSDVLAPGGVLILGAGENFPDGVDGFEADGSVVIRRSAARKAA
jgi:chemotaxis protein methyltransferase CheR